MNLLDTSPHPVRGKEIQAVQMHAQQLVDYARQHNLVVTITNEPQQPLAMGNYVPIIDVREAHRGS
ncbi:hypothetical protein J2W35_003239 [Variovorax boronicumulans]|uniref:hypothetical protein n=1 Tax=Variovorax boronicumulans TaxID=436515 RepID=UPI0027812614|nr:hypothetical protein [Variovorax boronicumulans]MDQ0082880.1 hypothetical protein [Variovorax boronicumulans]